MRTRRNGHSQEQILRELNRNNLPRVERLVGAKRNLLSDFNKADNNIPVPMEIEEEFKQPSPVTQLADDFSELMTSRKLK